MTMVKGRMSRNSGDKDACKDGLKAKRKAADTYVCKEVYDD